MLKLKGREVDCMQTFGKIGEDEAAEYLMAKGYEVIARNYRFKKSEIDIICRYQELLVFVEVKTRSSNAYGEPEEFVTASQQAAVLRAAENYVIEEDWQGDIRFDIIAILKQGRKEELTHFEDAFY